MIRSFADEINQLKALKQAVIAEQTASADRAVQLNDGGARVAALKTVEQKLDPVIDALREVEKAAYGDTP